MPEEKIDIRSPLRRYVDVKLAEKGWNLSDLATRMDTGSSNVSMFLNSNGDHRLKNLADLATALGVPLAEVVAAQQERREQERPR